MTEKAYAVPLHELLACVPRDARLVIDDPDGMGTKFIPVGRYCHEAAAELRAALAQPELEPVAWMEIEKYIDEDNLWDSRKILRDYDNGLGEPLYTTPPQREWVGLTTDELNLLWVDYHGDDCLSDGRILSYERAIEAKLREKNG